MFEKNRKIYRKKVFKLFVKWAVICGVMFGLNSLVLAEKSSSTASSYVKDFQRAMTLSQSTKPEYQDAALKQWRELQSQYPTDKAVANNYAVYLIKIGRIEEARAKIEYALKTDAVGEILMQNLSAIYAYQAQKAYQRLFEKAPVISPKVVWASVDEAVKKTPEQGKMALVDANIDKVLGRVKNWKIAWESQNVPKYLSFYASDFLSPKHPNHSSWRAARKRNLTKPRFIEINLSNIEAVALGVDLIQVVFSQHYKSNLFDDEVTKSMVWSLKEGEWKIVSERVVGK